MKGKLVLVGTPIGNLADFSPRAIETLKECDFIAAEDTRVTIKLLHYFGIKKELISCHEHNEFSKSDFICQRIENGETCVLVSDAGMPAISDPGELIVKRCAERDIEVCVVPGPSAVTAACALSGIEVGRFTFEGFLCLSKKHRKERLEELKSEKRTMVFYEAPHKLLNTLNDMLTFFGDRKIALCREITKIHEEVIRTTLSEAVKKYEAEAPKGEFVLVIEGLKEEAKAEAPKDALKIAKEFLEMGFSVSEAAKKASQLSGTKKGDIYKSLLEEKQ